MHRMNGRWALVPHVLFFLAIAVAQVNETLGGVLLLLLMGMALGLVWKSAGARGLLLTGLAGLMLAALVRMSRSLLKIGDGPTSVGYATSSFSHEGVTVSM